VGDAGDVEEMWGMWGMWGMWEVWEAPDLLNGDVEEAALERLEAHRLRLSELHAHTAHLHLPVGAAVVLECARRDRADAEVARAVEQAGAAVVRVGDELLGVELGAIKVAVRHLAAADAHLALLAVGQERRRVGGVGDVPTERRTG
jgi:hypothetical protein